MPQFAQTNEENGFGAVPGAVSTPFGAMSATNAKGDRIRRSIRWSGFAFLGCSSLSRAGGGCV
jgi:hypothetical protein